VNGIDVAWRPEAESASSNVNLQVRSSAKNENAGFSMSTARISAKRCILLSELTVYPILNRYIGCLEEGLTH
jgi:hypothetical protein